MSNRWLGTFRCPHNGSNLIASQAINTNLHTSARTANRHRPGSVVEFDALISMDTGGLPAKNLCELIAMRKPSTKVYVDTKIAVTFGAFSYTLI